MDNQIEESSEKVEENPSDEELFKLKVELKTVKLENERLVDSSKKIKAATMKLKDKLTEKTKSYDELMEEVKNLRDKVKEKEELHRENCTDLNEKLELIEKEKLENEETIKKLQKELEESIGNLETNKSEYDKLKIEYDDYKNKVDYLWKQKKDDSKESSFNNDFAEMANTIRFQNAKITELENEKYSLETEFGLLNESYKKLKDEFIKEKQVNVERLSEIEKDFDYKMKEREKSFEDEKIMYQQSIADVNNSNKILQKQVDDLTKQVSVLENQLSNATLQFSTLRKSTDVNTKIRSHSPEVKSIILPKFEPALNVRSSIETELFLNNAEHFSVDDGLSPPIEKNEKFNLRDLLNENLDEASEINPFNMDKWQGNETEEEITLEHYEEALQKLKHFECLLKDSEIWNSQLEEQVKFLKSELRRITNNEERMQHLKNIEYVKDVILKFMTDEKVENERKQLIPILKTLLKLSNEEVNVLENFSTKYALNNTSKSTNNWGSYFKNLTGM
uniref:GRIP domain-containing protein n=1 Tax=Strongyloides papillosus TaxID=174720 RepID=A0A0N5B631_STREA